MIHINYMYHSTTYHLGKLGCISNKRDNSLNIKNISKSCGAILKIALAC